ncbi:EAL domain-containing protein [Acetobacterium paludosum]|uniref:EAL domain-containing protein n=1 Tax=Acetobacterium paludosum TaxID=52693 RepID=A0A923KNH7_9FIRM|nr:GGDEF domain-containing phosphodiesterase [Acetobacterium paludosum]MBC3887134.1 EAL domain-containing protein [Acetobacterium paludosum]
MMNTKNNRKYRVFKNFVMIFVPIVIIIIVLAFAYINLNINNEKSIINIKQVHNAEIVGTDAESIFNAISSDGDIISNSSELKDYIHDNSMVENSNEIKRMFSNMIINKKTYNSIRIINIDGFEEIKVNYENENSQAVQDSDLQYKGDQDYFQEGMKLNQDENYISPLDLSVNNNVIDEPKKPIIRFVIPLFNENNERKGILVLDYRAQVFLNKIENDSINTIGMKTILLNEDGYYLLSDKADRNFAFMYDNKEAVSFRQEQPDLFDRIQNNESGYFDDKINLYYFISIFPLNTYHDIHWTLVEYVPLNGLEILNNEDNRMIAVGSTILAFVFFVISLIAAWLLVQKKEASEREKLTDSIFKNSKEGIIIMDEEARIVYVNESFSKITGYSEIDVIGRKTSEFKRNEKLILLYETIQNTVNENENWEGEIIDEKKDGTTYPRYITISKVFDSKSHELINYLEVFEDLTSTKITEETINKIKNYDEITELPTQLKFEENMKELIKKFDEFALIIIEITNFNTLNDNLGKKCGVGMIKEASNRIKTFLSKEDLVGKIGREQFVIARVNSRDKLKLDHFINKLTLFLQESIEIEDKKIYLDIAIGISIFQEHSADVEKLIEFANIAKNYAIQTGGNTFVHYEKEITHSYLENLKLETHLRSALKKNELSLNYQPQVVAGTKKIIGMEALLRWNNDELGSVGPAQFIPVAEKTDLIIPIGDWVLEEAIKQNKKWLELTNRRLVVAVNLSPVQFKKADFIEVIKQLLKKYELPAELLEVEVTEGILVKNIDSIKSKLDKIKELGVKVSIDDFGTGYSSLKYLKTINFDKLKIDREFIKNYPERDNGNIAKAIITLANQNGLKVLAEGVETKEQFIFLKDNGCDEIQGYYFYKPITASEFEKILLNENN